MTRTNYANGTCLITSGMWDVYTAGRAWCSDGVVRTLKRIAITPDTFFSIPAAVSVGGRTVSGYVSVDTANDPECTVVFTATGKNRDMLPSVPRDPDNPRDCEDYRVYGEHRFTIRLSVPRKSMGAVTGYDDMRECGECGTRVLASSLGI